MNKILPVILVLLVASGFVLKDSLRRVEQDSFSTGEVLRYKVHYGMINAAEAVIDIAPDIQRVNNRPCYKANVYGKTIGSFDFFLRIRDTWRSYIDTAAILPQRFHRNIEEGKYRKKENVNFDHYRNLATVEDKKRTENFKIPENVQDIVSGFYYMRTLNLEKYKVGDLIQLQGFFDDEVYDFTVVFQGREIIDTKAGSIRAFRLVPKLPANKLFSGENAVSVYLSDDKNKIPVMIKAEMLVGSIKVNLYQYGGLKYKLNTVKSL
ncbi:MAG: ATP-dependent exodnase [Adhaeribacter sp.]|nr:ATP-dependent exodnase [Adhaeribacter sp.]